MTNNIDEKKIWMNVPYMHKLSKKKAKKKGYKYTVKYHKERADEAHTPDQAYEKSKKHGDAWGKENEKAVETIFQTDPAALAKAHKHARRADQHFKAVRAALKISQKHIKENKANDETTRALINLAISKGRKVDVGGTNVTSANWDGTGIKKPTPPTPAPSATTSHVKKTKSSTPPPQRPKVERPKTVEPVTQTAPEAHYRPVEKQPGHISAKQYAGRNTGQKPGVARRVGGFLGRTAKGLAVGVGKSLLGRLVGHEEHEGQVVSEDQKVTFTVKEVIPDHFYNDKKMRLEKRTERWKRWAKRQGAIIEDKNMDEITSYRQLMKSRQNEPAKYLPHNERLNKIVWKRHKSEQKRKDDAIKGGIRKAFSEEKKGKSWNPPEVQAKAVKFKKEQKMFDSARREINRQKKKELKGGIKKAFSEEKKGITARKYEGDDRHSWAVFHNGRPVYTGLGKNEVAHYKKLVSDRAKEKELKEFDLGGLSDMASHVASHVGNHAVAEIGMAVASHAAKHAFGHAVKHAKKLVGKLKKKVVPEGVSWSHLKQQLAEAKGRDHIANAHQKEIDRKGAKVYNFGWGATGTGMASKTDHGVLDTEYDHKTKKYTHTWHEETVFEAQHSKGGGKKRVGLESDSDDHIINQLRKAKDLGSHTVTFKDKSKHPIDRDLATKALTHYGNLRTSIDKEHATHRMWHSHQGLHDVLAGKPAPKPKPKITLANHANERKL
jgi:hypothetical protein